MPSCLGLYIESNLIKYAKVSKERDNIKVESFGIKFYDRFALKHCFLLFVLLTWQIK